MVKKKTIIKKRKTSEDEKAIQKIEKLGLEEGFGERIIEVIPTSGAVLILLNKNSLYSVEWDCLVGRHYLLELSCEGSIKKPSKNYHSLL